MNDMDDTCFRNIVTRFFFSHLTVCETYGHKYSDVTSGMEYNIYRIKNSTGFVH